MKKLVTNSKKIKSIHFLKNLKEHKNIVKLYEVIDDDENDKLILVMEFMTATLSNKTLPLQEN